MRNQVKKVHAYQYIYILLFVLVSFAIAIVFYYQKEKSFREKETKQWYAIEDMGEPVYPIPKTVCVDSQKVKLGERLYYDKRLSGDNTISCASCHDLNKGGTDQKRYSTGVKGRLGEINSPTVFNSGFNFSQFWDGRATTLEEQAVGPIHNPVEMNSCWDEILSKLNKDPYYVDAFRTIYNSEIDSTLITDAIAEFERSLITPNAPFDKYLRGDETALTGREVEGYKLFKQYGCIGCHQGINLGGNMYQTLGVMEYYFIHRDVDTVDLGRFNVTRDSMDKFHFKVPTLRNVEVTYPYLHDGSAKELRDIIRVMSINQLGHSFKESEIEKIIAFLLTLTGEYKGKSLQSQKDTIGY